MKNKIFLILILSFLVSIIKINLVRASNHPNVNMCETITNSCTNNQLEDLILTSEESKKIQVNDLLDNIKPNSTKSTFTNPENQRLITKYTKIRFTDGTEEELTKEKLNSLDVGTYSLIHVIQWRYGIINSHDKIYPLENFFLMNTVEEQGSPTYDAEGIFYGYDTIIHATARIEISQNLEIKNPEPAKPKNPENNSNIKAPNTGYDQNPAFATIAAFFIVSTLGMYIYIARK